MSKLVESLILKEFDIPMKVCWNCGMGADEGATTCPDCGMSLTNPNPTGNNNAGNTNSAAPSSPTMPPSSGDGVESYVCGNCEAPVVENASFCFHCGSQLVIEDEIEKDSDDGSKTLCPSCKVKVEATQDGRCPYCGCEVGSGKKEGVEVVSEKDKEDDDDDEDKDDEKYRYDDEDDDEESEEENLHVTAMLQAIMDGTDPRKIVRSLIGEGEQRPPF